MNPLARNLQVQAPVQASAQILVQALKSLLHSEHSLTSKVLPELLKASPDCLTEALPSSQEPLLSDCGPLQSDASRSRRQVLSDSFNRASQTWEEAALNAARMVEDLERQGHLMAIPLNR